MNMETPDYHMMDFHPYHNGENPQHDLDSQTLNYMKSGTVYDKRRKDQFVGKVVAWLQEKVEWLLEETQAAYVVIAVAPGHSPTSPLSFMHEIVGTVIQNNQDDERMVSRVHDGRNLLIRTRKVPKQATSHGIRSEETHRNSIVVNPPDESYVDVTDEIVCVLDDVWTSGCTLRVCADKIRDEGAKDVRMLAIGKTAP